MKDGAHAIHRHPDPAARPFTDLSPGAPEQRFNIVPSEIGRRRLRKDAGKGPPVTAIHDRMISYKDIIASVYAATKSARREVMPI
jgi:hypothetical protein